MDNKKQIFNAKLENLEVRKVEDAEWENNGKVYRSLNIHFDTEECDRLVFNDKDIENKDKYQRGTVGTLILTISIEYTTKTNKVGNLYVGETTKITIKDFIRKEGE